MAPPPKPMYPPKYQQKPPYPPGKPGAPPPAGYKPGMPPPPKPGMKPGMPPPPPQGQPPKGMPPKPGPGPGPGAPPGKPGLPPPPPPTMVVQKPPPPKPTKVEKPKKVRKPKKFFDSGKKKVAVVILLIGLLIAAMGFLYPNHYWSSQNSYSSAQLKDYQQKTGTLIVYSKWDHGDVLSVHDTVLSIKEMRNTIYIEGVTYTQRLNTNNQPIDIGDNYLIEIENGQYFVTRGLQDPPLHDGDSIQVTGKMTMMIGRNSAGTEVRMEIMFVEHVDIDMNNMDTVFLGVGIMGIVIIFVGLGVWMFFVFMPEDKEPAYVNIHEQKKQEFIEQVATKEKGKEYPCPVCGLNMTYKPEFSKWYCDICNKLY